MVVSPDTILAIAGSNASFDCLTFVSDMNIPLDTMWEYPAGAMVAVEGTKLTVMNVSLDSEGDYKCKVTSSLLRTITAVGTLKVGMYNHNLHFLSLCLGNDRGQSVVVFQL